METFLWREQTLDIAQTIEAHTDSYRLGPLKAGVRVRVPLWLYRWLTAREVRRRHNQRLQDNAALWAAVHQKVN